MQSITVKYVEYVHACVCHFVSRNGMTNCCQALGLWIPLGMATWTHEPIHFTDTCLEVRGHPVRGNPPTVTWPGLRDSRKQMRNGKLSCPSNNPSNHILIEFQQTCKNLVEFCCLISQTDVPVIPVKWSATMMVSVWKHVNGLNRLSENKTCKRVLENDLIMIEGPECGQ